MFGRVYQLVMRKPAPYYWRYPIWLILLKPIRKFINVSIIPFIPFAWLRILLYRALGYRIGKNVFIGMRCYMDDLDPHLTTIGDNVSISYDVKFSVHGRRQVHTPIVIERDVYIGVGAIIISGKEGVVIGEGAVVAAGSVVMSNVPPNSMVLGSPARVMKLYSESAGKA